MTPDLNPLLLLAKVRPQEVPVRLVDILMGQELIQSHPLAVRNLPVALPDLLCLRSHCNDHIDITAPESCSVGMSDGDNRIEFGFYVRLLKDLSGSRLCKILLWKEMGSGLVRGSI